MSDDGCIVEHDRPLPPVKVRFVPPAAGESIAALRPMPGNTPAAAADVKLGPEWTTVPFEELLRGMDRPRGRPGRISVPTWETVYPRLPAGMYPPDRPSRVARLRLHVAFGVARP